MADNIVQILYNEVHDIEVDNTTAIINTERLIAIEADNTTAIINTERLTATWKTILSRS